MSSSDAKKRFPSLFQHLEELEKRIAGGCSAVIALIHKSRLFVANVGDARALFCRIDTNGDLGVVQVCYLLSFDQPFDQLFWSRDIQFVYSVHREGRYFEEIRTYAL